MRLRALSFSLLLTASLGSSALPQALPFPGPGGTSGAPDCTGGTVTHSGGNTVHTFTTVGSATITCTTGKSINYLVVAGGGGGGGTTAGTSAAGGGGAGGLRTGAAFYLPPGSTAVTVGVGGAGGVMSACSANRGTPGGNSILTNVATASGGGGGACNGNATGGAGGSGGGSNNGNAVGTGTAGQGNNGGNSAVNAGGGGGGCGAVGTTGTGTVAGNGGAGCSSSISGTSVCYAGGGAGGLETAGTSGTVTCGGGSAGATGAANPGVAGAANTGGGGGAANGTTGSNISGGAGGSGAVIVSYVTGSTQPPPPCTPNTDGGGTFANVVALYHFDNNGTDSSGNSRTLTLTGAATYSNVQAKFGGYAYKGGAAASTAAAATMGGTVPNIAGDITFEGWFYSILTTVQGAFGDNRTTVSANFNNSNTYNPNIEIQSGATVIKAGQGGLPINAWHHVAWVRRTNVWNIYLDGTLMTMGGTDWTNNVGNGSTAWAIGSFPAAAIYFAGYIDDFRISNMARYTANFTPQITAFCNN